MGLRVDVDGRMLLCRSAGNNLRAGQGGGFLAEGEGVVTNRRCCPNEADFELVFPFRRRVCARQICGCWFASAPELQNITIGALGCDGCNVKVALQAEEWVRRGVGASQVT